MCYYFPDKSRSYEVVNMDKELLGKCGYYCGQCPSYLAGKCKGCIKGNVGGECYARDCALNKKTYLAVIAMIFHVKPYRIIPKHLC